MSGHSVMTRVFVTGLKVQAEIGVYKRTKIDRKQPLVIDVELDVPTASADRLSETLNYETILAAARGCRRRWPPSSWSRPSPTVWPRPAPADPAVTRARVRVEKPWRSRPDAVAAGVEIILVRGLRLPPRHRRGAGLSPWLITASPIFSLPARPGQMSYEAGYPRARKTAHAHGGLRPLHALACSTGSR